MNQPHSTIYLVRHGETLYNIEGIVQGHSDSPLTETGIEQAETLNEMFRDVPFEVVYTSDLGRAIRTGEIIVADRNIPLKTSQLIRERCYGKFEGLPTDYFRNESKPHFEKMKSLSPVDKRKYKIAPDVESSEEIYSRLSTFFKELVSERRGKTILVISHGGTIRTLLNYLAWNPEGDIPSGAVTNTGYVKFRTDGHTFIIDDVSGIIKERKSN